MLTIPWMYVKCFGVRCVNFSSPHNCDKILKIPDNARSPWKIWQVVVGISISFKLVFLRCETTCCINLEMTAWMGKSVFERAFFGIFYFSIDELSRLVQKFIQADDIHLNSVIFKDTACTPSDCWLTAMYRVGAVSGRN